MADLMDARRSDERTQLLAFLDDARAEILEAVADLTDEQARRRLVPSLTSPMSILKHLVFVEQNWFQHVLAGRTRDEIGIVDDSKYSWMLTESDNLADLLADYQRACAEARETVESHDLDEPLTHRFMGDISLRFMLLHMIRETNRHAGHADILAEQIRAAG